MFYQWFVKVLERMDGRKLAAMTAAASESSVTERTLRNWLGNSTEPDPLAMAALRTSGRAALAARLDSHGWPAEQRDAMLADLDACPGTVSAMVVTLQNGATHYPAALQLAREIDLLDLRLDEYRKTRDLRGLVDVLLSTPWIDDAHLTDPQDDAWSALSVRRHLDKAQAWEDLHHPLALLVFNVQHQLLATLDLEFCAGYLGVFAPTPIFHGLLPRLAPGIDTATGCQIPIARDMFHYPVRRLLDTMACMRVRRSDGKWPHAMPSVKDFERRLELAGRPDLARDVVKWRNGRRFTTAQFIGTWESLYDDLPEPQQPPAPLAMMYAAAVFSQLFVAGSREQRTLSFVSPDPAIYRHWWDIQRNALATGSTPLQFGSEVWMPGFL